MKLLHGLLEHTEECGFRKEAVHQEFPCFLFGLPLSQAHVQVSSSSFSPLPVPLVWERHLRVPNPSFLIALVPLQPIEMCAVGTQPALPVDGDMQASSQINAHCGQCHGGWKE
jgi:hypothetical protein